MSLAYKLFLTFLYVRSAAIVNSGQHGLPVSREKGLQNPKPRAIRTTDGLRKILSHSPSFSSPAFINLNRHFWRFQQGSKGRNDEGKRQIMVTPIASACTDQ
jgi:hypothetical protein